VEHDLMTLTDDRGATTTTTDAPLPPLASRDARTGAARGFAVASSGPPQARAAAAAAGRAFAARAEADPAADAALLRAIATGLEDRAGELIVAADAESGLGEVRLRGELTRTTGQLEAFAAHVAAGDHLDVIADAPGGVALVRGSVPLGPVAMFAAGNFPFAFSVAGGDTAAALGAGCPVVVKAHWSHPQTSALAAEVVAAAVEEAGLPEGWFAILHGASTQLGSALVSAPEIAAVAFTGSLAGGRALADLAAARPQPIPVYAEMGSINPVFVTAAAAAARGGEIAATLAASITQGNGQFCTKPALVLVPGAAGGALQDGLAAAIAATPGAAFLNPAIADAFGAGLAALERVDGVTWLVGPSCGPSLAAAGAAALRAHPQLAEEVFGPFATLVTVRDDAELLELAATLPGALTATVFAQEGEDDELVRRLGQVLARRVGRLVFEGVPTGVAVSPAMMHGGPYPATSNPLHTSVGTTAIRRFLRPVAYQGWPQRLLPEALRAAP
jgi:NADP-dependent aldehyde dehydrogenase